MRDLIIFLIIIAVLIWLSSPQSVETIIFNFLRDLQGRPYISSVSLDKDFATYSDSVRFFYKIKNPSTYKFTPIIELNYSTLCFYSDFRPGERKELPSIPPRKEAGYYINLMVYQRCAAGDYRIEMYLLKDGRIIDEKSVVIRVGV